MDKKTAFPKGTIVKYNGIPCKLLQDTPYYSETYKSTQPETQSGEAVVGRKIAELIDKWDDLRKVFLSIPIDIGDCVRQNIVSGHEHPLQ